MSAVYYDAAAGSGKTTHLVRLASGCGAGNVLFTTFTDNNTEEIGAAFLREEGRIPANVDILPWFTFLLRECIRPFQGTVFELGDKTVSGIKLMSCASAKMTCKDELGHYGFWKDDGSFCIYSDKLSELALRINGASGGAVLGRLGRLYSTMCIDEVQDMSGYDLELIAEFIKNVSDVRLAGDQRQATYHTANVGKNKKYRALGFGQFAADRKLDCVLDSESLRVCHRCPQEVVDLADRLYPDLPPTIAGPRPAGNCRHIGVFLVRKADVCLYAKSWRAVGLTYSKSIKAPSAVTSQNMGEAKGRTFDRVLIFPTKDMLGWLVDHSVPLTGTSRAKLYVAITRARLSVAFVVPDDFSTTAAPFEFWGVPASCNH